MLNLKNQRVNKTLFNNIVQMVPSKYKYIVAIVFLIVSVAFPLYDIPNRTTAKQSDTTVSTENQKNKETIASKKENEIHSMLFASLNKDRLHACVVTRIIDGDTIEVSGLNQKEKTVVRLIGVDTYETKENKRAELQMKQSGKTLQQVLECGNRSRDFLYSLIPVGSKISIEYDVEKFDRYGRTLGYIWNNGNLINLSLLTRGGANTLHIKPNVKYKTFFDSIHVESK